MSRGSLVILVVVLNAALAGPAAARPGFSIGLGIGPSSASGERLDSTRLVSNQFSLPPGYVVSSDIDGGFSALFYLSYNIYGYAAIETRLTGHGVDLFDETKRAWAAHWHTGVRGYPLWHWQDRLPEYLQPLEPSIFIGWGGSFAGLTPDGINDVAFSTWNSWRFGFAFEYFFVPFFKVGLDYTYVLAPFSTFIFDLDNSIDFDIEPSASSGFHQFYVVASFQFGPAQEPHPIRDNHSQ